MLALAQCSSLGIIIPVATPPSVVLPTTMTLAKGMGSYVPQGEIYAGGTDSLNLDSMLDGVPADMKGEVGVSVFL